MNPQTELELIRSILENVSSTVNAEKVLGFAMEEIKKAFNCLASAIILLDPKAGSFKAVTAKGWGYEFLKTFHASPYHGLIEEMGRQWEPVFITGDDPRKGTEGYTFQHDYGTLLALPLSVRGRPVGLLYLSWSKDMVVDKPVQAMLTDMARLCALVLDHGYLDDKVFSMSNIDPLTGLYSYKYWHEEVHKEIVRAEKLQSRVAIMVVNLNRFKELNAMLGHVKGDDHLIEVSEIINRELGTLDVPCRVGGKWNILLAGEGLDAARETADRILRSFENLRSEGGSVTNLSIGLSLYKAGEGEKALLERVDGALLEARRQGPNSCSIA